MTNYEALIARYKKARANLKPVKRGDNTDAAPLDKTMRAPKNVAMGKKIAYRRSPYGAVHHIAGRDPKPIFWSVGDEAVD